jgi:hypothetical protein
MLKAKKYKYVFDVFGTFNAVKLLRAISVVPSITDFAYSKESQVLEVKAVSDPEESIKLACEIAGARLRVKMKRPETKGDFIPAQTTST